MKNGKRKYRPLWILITLVALGLMPDIMAQDPAFFSQHLNNQLVYNPAFAGNRKIPGLSFLTRQQWLSWEGSPTSTALFLHTKLKNKNAGTGFSLYYDAMGPIQNAGLSWQYSYSLQLSENNRIVLGLQGELTIRQLELSRLQLIDQGDLLFAEDPGIQLQPNVGFGFNYMAGKYSIYMSVPRILNSKLSPYEGESSEWSTTMRVFYMGANTRFELSENLDLVPSLLVALSRGHTPFIELFGLFDYQKLLGFGFLYRYNKTVGATIRYNHKESLVFGYAYDVSLNMMHYNAGTHELFIGYNFQFNRTKTISPRRF